MKTKTTVITCVAVAAILFAGTGIVASQQSVEVSGEPDLEVYVPDNIFSPGEATELTLEISNEGEVSSGQETNRQLVTTARNVVVDVDAEDSPINVVSRPDPIGSVSDSEPRAVPVQIEIPDDAEPGTYELEVDIEYRYTDRVKQTSEVADQDEESREIERDIEIEIDDDARFRVTNVSSNLRVGEDGEITGEIENIGEQDATNAEVRFPTETENVFPLETAVAVGDVPAGESTEFRIPIEVGSEAEAVPKRFDLPVSFRDENGIRQTDDDPEFLADIAPERDTFAIEGVDRSITAGSSSTLEVTFTNNREETLTDIEPKLFTDSPFSSSSDEGFVDSLDPGESETVTFDLSAEGSATPKTYPVTVDVRYQDAEGESRITDSYRLPVEVLESEESGGLGSLGTIVVLVASLLAVGGGYVWYRGQ